VRNSRDVRQDVSQVEELFHAAREIAPPGRDAFLAQACGDNLDLLREVESLLAFDDSSFLQSVVGDVTREVLRLTSLAPGARVGPYVILSEIGRGGMGTVYLAARADGQFEQKVALKVIGGAPSPEGLQRFLTERQVLANLQHPNIARLLEGGMIEGGTIEGGTTEGRTMGGNAADGQPYFAMEYLEGESLTAYFARRQSSLAERLEIFEQVCAAIHYAHQKLVIHRDLKPSNILITADGTAKILDFGIARLTGATAVGEPRVFTPCYASPEQFLGPTVSTASDIYSLGAVLYEVLTSRRPYDFKGVSLAEMERVICKEDPPAPDVDAALDSIVRMAMAKEPERRYGSAQALAEDLRRYRNGFPVLAHGGGIMYRAGRGFSRHRLASAVGAVLLISWLAGTVVVLHQARVSEQRSRQVRDLADTLLFDFNGSSLGASPSPATTEGRAAMVKRALDNLGELARGSQNDPSLDLQIAIAYERVGEAQGDPLNRSLGDSAGAERSYKASLGILERLKPATLAVTRERMRVLLRLGVLRRDAGSMTEAKAAFLKGVELADVALRQAPKDAGLRNDAGLLFEALTRAYNDTGFYKEAGESLNRAFALFRQLLREDPTNRDYRDGIANTYGARMALSAQLGKTQEALADAREILRLREGIVRDAPGNFIARRNLMLAYARVGDILGYPPLANLGDYHGAASYFRQTLETAEKLAADDPTDRNGLSDMNMARMRLAITLIAAGERDEASPHLRTGLAETEQLLKADPGHKRYLTNASTFHHFLADEATRAGNFKDAERHLDSAEALLKKVFARDAKDALGAVIGLDIYVSRLQLEAARKNRPGFQRVEQDLLLWVQRFADGGPRLRGWALLAFTQAGEMRAQMGDVELARAWYERSLNGWQQLQEKKLLPSKFSGEPERVGELLKASTASKKDKAVKKLAKGTTGS